MTAAVSASSAAPHIHGHEDRLRRASTDNRSPGPSARPSFRGRKPYPSIADASRYWIGSASSGTTAAERCARNVTAHDAATSSEKRAFFQRQPPPAFRAAQRPEIQQQEQRGQRHQHGLRGQSQGEKHERQGVVFPPSPARVTGVGQQRQAEEERAQHILALGDPGHRFDVQRMHHEEQGRPGARPERPRGRAQPPEQQDRVGEVQQQVRQVVTPGVQAVELGIEHQGEPRQRVPVGPLETGPRPMPALPRQAVGDVRVFKDVAGIVEADERKAEGLTVDRQTGRDQHEDDQQFGPVAGRWQRLSGGSHGSVLALLKAGIVPLEGSW